MLGYVRTDRAELRVREDVFYRALYCGLCHRMGKCTGNCSRMTLNYDFVFLALVRMALDTPRIRFEQKRCLAHPFKKRNSMVRNDALDYCSGASAILNYQKVKDDIADEKGFKKLRARLALPFVAHARKKAIKKHPSLRELDETVARKLAELSALEKSDRISVDEPANCFGELLGHIMSFGFEGSDARVAFEFGKSIGAWIYIADALDDMHEDFKKGRYNPFIRLYGGNLPSKEQLTSIYYAIKNRLYSAEAAFDLFDTEDGAIKSIIQNVIYLGIPEQTESVTGSDKCKCKKRKSGKETAND